jgi:hypothetical protein
LPIETFQLIEETLKRSKVFGWGSSYLGWMGQLTDHVQYKTMFTMVWNRKGLYVCRYIWSKSSYSLAYHKQHFEWLKTQYVVIANMVGGCLLHLYTMVEI